MKNQKHMLGQMILLACNMHYRQYDKQGEPYILHTLKVMELLNTEDEELRCIAVGHDLLEDTGITAEALLANYSERVVSGIQCLTKINGETYEQYKEKVKSNPDSILVKIADLKHNSDITRLKGLTDKDIERTTKYHKFYLELNKIVADARNESLKNFVL